MNNKENLNILIKKCSNILKNKYHVKRVFVIGSLVNGIINEKSENLIKSLFGDNNINNE